MGKWNPENYDPKWEKESVFKQWLQPTSKADCNLGKPQAYCKLCHSYIRAHHRNLIAHSKSKGHKERESSLNTAHRPNLHGDGCIEISDQSKISDLRLAMCIASHCSVKTIDHLGEIIKVLGKGSQLENIRLNQTKCSILISAVIAPAILTELMKDIGDRPYALIVDEATDVSWDKFMGVCVRYFSQKRRKMVTDFLGIVQVTSCTGGDLAKALREYLAVIGLPLKKLNALGTDGPANMCGLVNSLFTHLKQYVPGLILLKCTFHSIDKSAQYAFKKLPDQLTYILSESHHYFAHSVKRLSEYSDFYKAANQGKNPTKLQPLSKTRWLAWLPVSEILIEQWFELRDFFASKKNTGDFKAETLANLFADSKNFLYLNFLRTVLRRVHSVNLSFEKTDADVTKLYTDLRTLVFSLAGRIVKPSAMAETAKPGMLRSDEVEMLKNYLKNPSNLLPSDRANFGENFNKLLPLLNLSEEDLATVRKNCGDYIMTLCLHLLDRMPSSLHAIAKLKFLSPRLALAKSGRPTFQQLPTELADVGFDLDVLDSQWTELGTLSISDICPPTDSHGAELDGDLAKLDSVYFWSCVLNLENAYGVNPFEDLANFALKALTMPISNAMVERIFSIMSCVKTKQRNSLQLQMLEALLRSHVHIKVDGLCCNKFVPTKEMINNFNATMYAAFHSKSDLVPSNSIGISDTDLKETIELITMCDPDNEMKHVW